MEFLLESTRLERASAKEEIFSWSKFVVGSSKAITPQLALNVSAKDRRIMREAKTYLNIIYEAIMYKLTIFTSIKSRSTGGVSFQELFEVTNDGY